MKKIKILTITLAIVAITMVAFFGVYTQKQNRMENQVKENSYAMDLKGSRNIRLKVSTETKTTIKDAEGKEVEDSEGLTDEQIAEKGYIKEEKPINPEDITNVENYQISQKIIEKRLKKLGINNYKIKLDEKTGNMVIEIPENDKTDSIISNLNTTGKFEILDSETNEILMDNSSIKEAKVMYSSGNGTTGTGTTVYLDIEFNREGSKKIEEISSQYIKDETVTAENTTSEEETNEEDTTTSEEVEQTTIEKKITMKIDDEEIMSTSFEEPIKTGKLQLSVGSKTTDTEVLQGYIDQASNMATVLDIGKMPVKYEIEDNQYVLSDIKDNEAEVAIYVVLGIVLVAFIVLVVKHKLLLGSLGIVSYIGFLSIFILIIPYTNVIVSIEGLVGMIIILVLNYILINRLLARPNSKKDIYKEFFIKLIPIIIMMITFCFIKWTPLSSFGMVMFWGIALIAIYNSLITNSLLKINAGKEKKK